MLNEDREDDVLEVWLYDTKTLTFTRITSASASDRDSQYPSLSGDGTIVAFESDSDLLNEGRPDNVSEVWLYDTQTLTFTRVTSASAGDRDSKDPSMSRDGTLVTFKSDSDLLTEVATNNAYEIWLWGKEFAYDIYLPLVLGQP